ncbi:MAG: hypothetical protein ACRDTP_09000, partial [Mycobacteriales bacterium]
MDTISIDTTIVGAEGGAGSTSLGTVEDQAGAPAIDGSSVGTQTPTTIATGSPTAGTSADLVVAGTTPPAPGETNGSATDLPAPESSTILGPAPATDSTTQTGTLGARGPPNSYGPVLITAATGGSIVAGAATLTFAPGSLPHDAYVSVTVTPAPSQDGLYNPSDVYDLKAVDTATGALIEHFNSAPQLTIDAGSPVPQAIYYLPIGGSPVPIPSTYNPVTGAVTAGLPHFSQYTAALGVQDLFGWIKTELAGGTLTGAVNAPTDLSVGAVVELTTPTLTFSVTANGSTYTGKVTISATGGGIDAGNFNANFGAITGSYSLSGQSATGGALSLTVTPTTGATAISITVSSALTLTAGSLAVSAKDDGTTTQVAIGAANVAATLTAGTATLSVTGATLGLVSRNQDSLST